MTGTCKSMGDVLLSRVRSQRCGTEGCGRKSRMALVMPLSDIGPGGTPGLGCVVLCGDHIEGALARLVKALGS